MKICYSSKSAMSAQILANELGATLTRSGVGDINWGRANTQARLNANTNQVTNKRIMCELFQEHGVPAPHLYGDAQFLHFPVVGRSEYHSKGRGFWLCNSISDVNKAMRGTRKKAKATHFMEFVSAPREYRVHIFNGKSIRISEKAFGETGTSSTGNYTTRKPQHDVSHVREAAKKAMQAVGLDFGAVDVLANDNQAWVLECNSAPHLGGTLPKLYADNFRKYFES